MGDASSVRLAIDEETVFGGARVGSPKYLRFTSEDLRLQRNTTQSAEIDPNRQPAGTIPTSKSVTGSINTELSLIAAANPPTGYDVLYEAALLNDWSTATAGGAADLTIALSGAADFNITDNAATVFSDFVVGQWIKITDLAVNGTVWARIVVKNGNDDVDCEGVAVAADGTVSAVQAETDATATVGASSYLRIGSTKKSYAMERDYSDLTVPEYSLYTGMWCATWERSVSPENIVTEVFGWAGSLQDTTTSQTLTTPAAKWATPRVDAVDGVSFLLEGDFSAPSSDCVRLLSHSLDNRARIDLCIGEDGPQSVGVGVPTFTGRISTFMSDADLLRKFEDRTESKLCYLVDDGTRQQLVTVTRITYTDSQAPAAGNDQPVEITGEWAAEADTDGITLQIDRF